MSLHSSFSSALSSPLAATNQCLDENAALELLDARLASAARTRIERHLEGCDACRELVAELTKVDGVGDQSAEIKAPPVAVAAVAASSAFAQSQNADTQEQAFHLARELAAGARIGPYRVEQAIGSGSFGTVYRATDDRNGQVVALKMVVDPGLRARFSREAATLSRLDHPAIVRYVGHGLSNEGMYLAMEWLEGEDLEQRLRRGPVGWQQTRVLGLRLAAALAHAHGLGCVHRDLSPRNIYLPHGRVEEAKLLDFGLVRIDTASFQTSMALERTATQAMLGTPYYMSPEQIRDPKSVDGRADLFGLGILLYESICGKRPFDGDDLFTVWIKIVDQPAPDLRKLAREPVPDAFVRLVESLLAKDPAARPQSASDVERVLVNLNLASSSIAMPMSAPPPAMAYSAPPLASSSATAPPVSSVPFVAMPQPFVTGPPPPIHPSFLPPSYAHPSQQPQQPPPQSKSRTGVFIAVGAVSATVVIVGAGAVGVAVALHGGAIVAPSAAPATTAAPTTTGAPNPNSSPTATSPTAAAKKAGGGVVTPTPTTTTPGTPTASATATTTNKGGAKGGAAPPEHFFCGGDQVTTRSGGNYVADNEAGDAVIVGGDCKATLEDCTIAGPHSVNVLGTSSLTIRRCRILGDVKLVGPSPTLILEGTSTPRAPQIVGGGKVIRR